MTAGKKRRILSAGSFARAAACSTCREGVRVLPNATSETALLHASVVTIDGEDRRTFLQESTTGGVSAQFGRPTGTLLTGGVGLGNTLVLYGGSSPAGDLRVNGKSFPKDGLVLAVPGSGWTIRLPAATEWNALTIRIDEINDRRFQE
jgi:hypothetical protein